MTQSHLWSAVSESTLYLKAAQELRNNPGQWEAYNSAGHCVVLAGPGSGKTKTLTTKLARMLAEDIEEPRGLACLTYNNECARELETRLENLGVEPGRRVFIGTVHSFSLTQILMPYAKTADLGLPEDFSVATRQQQSTALGIAFRKTIGGSGDPNNWRMQMDHYRRSILNRDAPEWRGRNAQMAGLIEAYEAALRARDLIDFDDMPLMAVRALREHEWIQRALLAKYPVLAVDEYQDLGRALHRMVLGLCFSTGMRLFAVGDIDQSIYGFTGAYPELLKQLSERDDVETISLRLNYRCGSRIVAASAYALGEDRDYEAAEGAAEGTIFFHPRPGVYAEHAEYFFATLLPAILERQHGLRLGQIAILYPAAWIGDAVAEAAAAYGFGVLRSDTNALYPRSSRLMRWVELCAIWCCSGWQSGIPRLSKLHAEGCRIFSEVITSVEKQLSFKRSLIDFLWNSRDGSESLYVWLSRLRADVLQVLLGGCRTLGDDALVLDTFLGRIGPGGNIDDMSLALFSGFGEGNDRIVLSTLHSAKGREFAVVVLFGMDEGRLPRANSSAREVLESRRLFYVGFTRAESELHLVYSSGRPSPFIREVQDRIE
ncbi:ATP-dependent helicase [Mesorhizobium sp. M0830]|uniref:ATP-dependent helicase n=1 Tax=Mesorhizobium sp. M0830 TaxID=2957008 RepID=UPI003338D8FE